MSRPAGAVPARVVGWGVVGCGWVARDYVVPALVASANGRVVALCDPDPAALAAVARVAPGAARCADLGAFLAAPGLDAVYVATPNFLHAPLTVAAAAAGKAVLCEKPMATTVADAEAMVAACAAAGVAYATAFDQRFHGAHRHLRELVAEGALGTVTAARVHYACWTPPDWAPATDAAAGVRHDNWRADPARAGGGALVDLAPHGLDLLPYLVGEPLVEVVGLRQRRVFDYPVDDGAAVVGRFAGGALATLQVAYNCPDAYPRRTLELFGTKAMAVATNTMGQTPGGTLELVSAADGVRRAVPVPPEEDRSPFLGQVEAFAACLLEGRPYPFPPEADLATMRLLDAANGAAIPFGHGAGS